MYFLLTIARTLDDLLLKDCMQCENAIPKNVPILWDNALNSTRNLDA
jgi:hypothetical protein